LPYLYGKQIMLRDYRQEDLPAIRDWVNDRQTIRYLSSRFWMPQSITDTSDFLSHAMSAGTNGAYFIIAQRESEAYLGQIDLFSINWRLRSAEMGMVIAREKNRGQGVGVEAILLLLEYAFAILGLNRVELEVAAENTRALRCYQKAGFQQEGVKRKAFMVDGQYADLVMMSVLADEWREKQNSRSTIDKP
jgi:RimJ/RimL family protein N-acetyltransferase